MNKTSRQYYESTNEEFIDEVVKFEKQIKK